jgi:hypothetical protein
LPASPQRTARIGRAPQHIAFKAHRGIFYTVPAGGAGGGAASYTASLTSDEVEGVSRLHEVDGVSRLHEVDGVSRLHEVDGVSRQASAKSSVQ